MFSQFSFFDSNYKFLSLNNVATITIEQPNELYLIAFRDCNNKNIFTEGYSFLEIARERFHQLSRNPIIKNKSIKLGDTIYILPAYDKVVLTSSNTIELHYKNSMRIIPLKNPQIRKIKKYLIRNSI